MRFNQVIAVVLGALLMSGCGDQFWCGDDGCRPKKIVSTADVPMHAQSGSILVNIL